MVTLLLFALVTFLYGVHLDRRFMGVGVFLGLSYVVMSYMAAYIWILLLIAVLMVAVAIFMMKRTYSKKAATGPAMTPPVLLPKRTDEDFVQEGQPRPKQRERESRQ
jgi:membrane glycosyltransferase